VTTAFSDGSKTITTPDGTVTTLGATDGVPDGSSTVLSTLPPAGSGLTTGPAAVDPNDPQQGQQAIGFTHQVMDSIAPSDPTISISDEPNTAHIQGSSPEDSSTPSAMPGSTALSSKNPHKPHSP
jgi:hypothetical protein